MKKSEIIFLGVIIIIAIVGLLIFWYSRTIPNDEEITSAAEIVKSVDKNILSEKTSQLLDSLQVHGQTSTSLQDNYNNEDPFF